MNEITLPLEVNLRRYIYNILTGNNSEILLCILHRIKIFIGVTFRSKRSYSYFGIRLIESTLINALII